LALAEIALSSREAASGVDASRVVSSCNTRVFSASASASVVSITRCNTSSERTVDCCAVGVLSPILSPTFGSVCGERHGVGFGGLIHQVHDDVRPAHALRLPVIATSKVFH